MNIRANKDTVIFVTMGAVIVTLLVTLVINIRKVSILESETRQVSEPQQVIETQEVAAEVGSIDGEVTYVPEGSGIPEYNSCGEEEMLLEKEDTDIMMMVNTVRAQIYQGTYTPISVYDWRDGEGTEFITVLGENDGVLVATNFRGACIVEDGSGNAAFGYLDMYSDAVKSIYDIMPEGIAFVEKSVGEGK